MLDTEDPEQNHDHDQEQESVLPTTSSSREWDKPRKSVEFSPSSTKRVSSVQQPTISEAERTLEGNGPSVEFPNKGQGIVFPSSEILPVNYPEGKEKEILNNSEQLENNKIDSIISSSSNREDSSRSLSPEQSNTRAGTFRPGPEQEVGDGSELFETSSKDQEQENNSGREFDSNLVDDEARVAPQILAANIPSYHPSYPNRNLKPNDQKDSPVSSPNSSSKDNLPTRSVVESRLVVVVGSLTVIALVLVLLVMLLLCRYKDSSYFLISPNDTHIVIAFVQKRFQMSSLLLIWLKSTLSSLIHFCSAGRGD